MTKNFFPIFHFFLVGTDQVMSVLLKNIFFSSILVFSRDLQWFLMHSSNLISLVDSAENRVKRNLTTYKSLRFLLSILVQ